MSAEKSQDRDKFEAQSTGDLVIDSDQEIMTVELLSDGRLRAPRERTREFLRERLKRAQVLATGPGWSIIRTLDAAPSAFSREQAEAAREVVLSGSLGESSVALIDMIGFLAAGLETGVLTVAQREVELSIYLHKGDVVWASSNAEDDSIGEFLVRRGKITPDQLGLVSQNAPRGVGRACVTLGFIAAHDLFAMVQAQLTEIFDRLLTQERGVWWFSRIKEELLAQSELQLPTQGLLIDGLRKLDEMRLFRSVVRSQRSTVQPIPERFAQLPKHLTKLDPVGREAAAELLKKLPSSSSVQELMRQFGKSEFELTRLIYQLHRAELVAVSSEAPSVPPRVHAGEPTKVEAREVILIYSLAIREIMNELPDQEALRQAAQAFISDPQTPHYALLHQVRLLPNGGLEEGGLLAAVRHTEGLLPHLSDALSELLFFLLFEATEQLPARRRDDLARRVKMIYGMLKSSDEDSSGER